MPFGVVGWVGPRNHALDEGQNPPKVRGQNLGGNGWRSVTYRENMALWCGCSIPAAE